MSNLKKLKIDMEGLSKLEEIKHQDLRKPKKYMDLISMEDARHEFCWRTGMLDNRRCMGKRYRGKVCPHCQEGVEETSLH